MPYYTYLKSSLIEVELGIMCTLILRQRTTYLRCGTIITLLYNIQALPPHIYFCYALKISANLFCKRLN